MHEFLNPVAELDKPDSGELVNPNVAYQLKEDHKFYCPDFDCKDSERILIIKKSSNGNPFFSHKPGFFHDINPETLLHKSAIKWFLAQTEFEIPSCDLVGKRLEQQTVILDPTKTKPEFRKLEHIIPDVKLTTISNFEFAIEIVVTNDVSQTKSKRIHEFGLPTIRIDLQDFYKANKTECQINLDFIQRHLPGLMSDIVKKTWVIAPQVELIQEKVSLLEIKTDNSWLGKIAFASILFIVYKIIRGIKK